MSISAGNGKMEGNTLLPREEEIQKLKAPERSLQTLRQCKNLTAFALRTTEEVGKMGQTGVKELLTIAPLQVEKGVILTRKIRT